MAGGALGKASWRRWHVVGASVGGWDVCWGCRKGATLSQCCFCCKYKPCPESIQPCNVKNKTRLWLGGLFQAALVHVPHDFTSAYGHIKAHGHT